MNMASAKSFFTNVTFLEGIEFDLKLMLRGCVDNRGL